MPFKVSENTFVCLAPEFKDKKIKICFVIAWYGEVFLIMEAYKLQACYWLVCQLQFFTTVNSIQEKSELTTLNKLVAVSVFWLCILISRFVSLQKSCTL